LRNPGSFCHLFSHLSKNRWATVAPHIVIHKTFCHHRALTRVWNFIPGYKISYLGTKVHTRVQTIIPGYKISCQSTKVHTKVQNYHTRVQNFIPGFKTSY
jgi:hypothetical protein